MRGQSAKTSVTGKLLGNVSYPSADVTPVLRFAKAAPLLAT